MARGEGRSFRLRPLLVFWHRWFGLLSAVWLVLMAVTGSLIVLNRTDWPTVAMSIVWLVTRSQVKTRMPKVNMKAVGSRPNIVVSRTM